MGGGGGGGGGGVVKDVGSKAQLDEALHGAAPVVVHFWASWCEASKQMDQVFAHLATDFPQALFLRVCIPLPLLPIFVVRLLCLPSVLQFLGEDSFFDSLSPRFCTGLRVLNSFASLMI